MTSQGSKKLPPSLESARDRSTKVQAVNSDWP